jgi:hypothetical protein
MMERNIYVKLDENNLVIDFIGVPKDGYVLKSNYKNASYLSEGFFVDDENQSFVPPKPYESWILNEETCLWEAPVAYPADGFTHTWNEETLTWDLIENSKRPESWIFNEDTIRWEPPVAYPDDGKKYAWNEESVTWDLIEDRI